MIASLNKIDFEVTWQFFANTLSADLPRGFDEDDVERYMKRLGAHTWPFIVHEHQQLTVANKDVADLKRILGSNQQSSPLAEVTSFKHFHVLLHWFKRMFLPEFVHVDKEGILFGSVREACDAFRPYGCGEVLDMLPRALYERLTFLPRKSILDPQNLRLTFDRVEEFDDYFTSRFPRVEPTYPIKMRKLAAFLNAEDVWPRALCRSNREREQRNCLRPLQQRDWRWTETKVYIFFPWSERNEDQDFGKPLEAFCQASLGVPTPPPVKSFVKLETCDLNLTTAMCLKLYTSLSRKFGSVASAVVPLLRPLPRSDDVKILEALAEIRVRPERAADFLTEFTRLERGLGKRFGELMIERAEPPHVMATVFDAIGNFEHPYFLTLMARSPQCDGSHLKTVLDTKRGWQHDRLWEAFCCASTEDKALLIFDKATKSPYGVFGDDTCWARPSTAENAQHQERLSRAIRAEIDARALKQEQRREVEQKALIAQQLAREATRRDGLLPWSSKWDKFGKCTILAIYGQDFDLALQHLTRTPFAMVGRGPFASQESALEFLTSDTASRKVVAFYVPEGDFLLDQLKAWDYVAFNGQTRHRVESSLSFLPSIGDLDWFIMNARNFEVRLLTHDVFASSHAKAMAPKPCFPSCPQCWNGLSTWQDGSMHCDKCRIAVASDDVVRFH